VLERCLIQNHFAVDAQRHHSCFVLVPGAHHCLEYIRRSTLVRKKLVPNSANNHSVNQHNKLVMDKSY